MANNRKKFTIWEEVDEDVEDAKGLGREIFELILYLVFVFALTYLVITYVGQRTHVSGSSMENTLSDGDNLIVDKITYRFSEPERFDIVVFPFRYQEETYYIKRIIGMPGETIWIADGNIYIDGTILEESYGREVIRDAGIASEPIQLGEDEYFVMGDNRNASADSRDPSVGKVHREEFIGRAWLRIWPLRKFELVTHQ